MYKIAILPPGSEIMLLQPPTSVNFKMAETGLDGKPASTFKKWQLAMLQECTIAPSGSSDIIIPISSLGEKDSNYQLQLGWNNIAQVVVIPALAYEPVYKAQGRIIPQAVLALSEHPDQHLQMNYAFIFAVMSCMKHHMNILFLSNATGSLQK